MFQLRLAAFGLALSACLVSTRPAAQTVSSVAWLDRYERGEFESIALELEDFTKFESLFDDLKDKAPGWIEGGGPEGRDRRRLAAATFALEAARAAEWREWKWIQKPPPNMGHLPVLYWKPAPLLLEWACTLVREAPPPRPIEHVWQLAALAVAQRSEDAQFLIGATSVPGSELPAPRFHPEEVVNPKAEIGHLSHAMIRFPDELRFLLAQAVARERYTPGEAIVIYRGLGELPGIGGEARVRLGALHLRRGRVSDALGEFERAERLTRDPWVLHLLWVFRGQALARNRDDAGAIAAYRTATTLQPQAQTSALLLAEQLFRAGQRAESQSVAAVMLQNAGATDPYLEFVHGDDRFWPTLILRLHAEVRGR